MDRLSAVIGIIYLLGLAVAFSSARRSIPWKTVGIGLLLQLLFAVAKILVPESGPPLTAGTVRINAERTDRNLIDAAARGASRGVWLAGNIAAMLIAFITLIALGNAVLGGLGQWSGACEWLGQELTFQLLLGYLLASIAFLVGVPRSDASAVGQVIGTKLILNEFVAFGDCVGLRETMSGKAQLIAG